MISTDKVFALARKHLGSGAMESSARICLEDAMALNERGLLDLARARALKSIAYSVGVFHADYRRACG